MAFYHTCLFGFTVGRLCRLYRCDTANKLATFKSFILCDPWRFSIWLHGSNECMRWRVEGLKGVHFKVVYIPFQSNAEITPWRNQPSWDLRSPATNSCFLRPEFRQKYCEAENFSVQLPKTLSGPKARAARKGSGWEV